MFDALKEKDFLHINWSNYTLHFNSIVEFVFIHKKYELSVLLNGRRRVSGI